MRNKKKPTKLQTRIKQVSEKLEQQIAAVHAEVERLAAERGAVQSEFDKPSLERKPWLGETLPKLMTLEQISWDLLGKIRLDLEELRYNLVDLKYAVSRVGIAPIYVEKLALATDTQFKLLALAAKFIERLEAQLKMSGVAKGELKDADAKGVTVVVVPSIDMSNERAVEAAIEVQLANGPWQHLLDARKEEPVGVREDDSEAAG